MEGGEGCLKRVYYCGWPGADPGTRRQYMDSLVKKKGCINTKRNSLVVPYDRSNLKGHLVTWFYTSGKIVRTVSATFSPKQS